MGVFHRSWDLCPWRLSDNIATQSEKHRIEIPKSLRNSKISPSCCFHWRSLRSLIGCERPSLSDSPSSQEVLGSVWISPPPAGSTQRPDATKHRAHGVRGTSERKTAKPATQTIGKFGETVEMLVERRGRRPTSGKQNRRKTCLSGLQVRSAQVTHLAETHATT